MPTVELGKMKMYVFEGTPEELSQVAKTLQTSAPLAEVTASSSEELAPEEVSAKGEEVEGVTVKFARRVLRRRELSEPLKAVFRRLYEANDWVGIEELGDACGYSRQQFAGLMGAFGRRIANTEGYDRESAFFYWEWDDETGAWKYRLPDTVREALKLENVV